MKSFLKNISFGVILFASGIAFSRFEVFASLRHFLSSGLHFLLAKTGHANPEAVENYYDFIMKTALMQGQVDLDRKATLDKICVLCTNSGEAFEVLMQACEKSEKVIPQKFIEPLHKYGFVDVTGTINYDQDAFKILKEMALRIKTESRLVPTQIISNTVALCDFFKVFTKSLVVTDPGSYQESLLDFKFSFSRYRDVLQLFSESFLEKDYYFEAANENPFIIDCGSNLGMSILFFKKFYPKAEVLAFEPSHICLPFLKKNISDNNLDGITIVDKAVSNKKGVCFFHECPSNTLGAALGSDPDSDCAIRVDSVLLSEYIQRPVDFVKMDIEGAEIVVFEDLDQSEKIKFIKEMGIECHGNGALNVVLKILNKNDFIYQVKREDLWGDAYLVHAFNQKK